jgi:hypothetical protein
VESLEERLTPSVTVSTLLDPTTAVAGQLSLRQAINLVNAGQVPDNTVLLPAGTYLNSQQGALSITHSLTMQGAGVGSTAIDAAGPGERRHRWRGRQLHRGRFPPDRQQFLPRQQRQQRAGDWRRRRCGGQRRGGHGRDIR